MQKKNNLLKGALFASVAFTALLNSAKANETAAMSHTPMHQENVADNAFWWPNRLDLEPLRKNATSSNPLGEDFDYAKAFGSLDLNALKKDLQTLMHTSKDWWPADYGHYGPLFIRLAWHSAGTYRRIDGRGGADGGMQRFAPLNSWPDNANLDKARRLLWPIKEKYGDKISWGDLIILSGTVAMEDMGFKTIGFAGGRVDAWEPDNVDWGPESKWLAHNRQTGGGKLKGPLAATQMGLIYVNPEGPGGNPDPWDAAKAIREAFGRMAMNDEETVALIAGGHTFGKTHGAADPSKNVGPEPEAAGLEEQGLGWKNSYRSGKGADTITSGLEGAWTVSPAEWTHNFLQNLFTYNWVKTKSPAGAIQWVPDDESAASIVPDAHDPDKFHAPIMLTTDLALKFDPSYRKIAKRFYENPETFELAFAKAWFKLTHRDMGPPSRYLGTLVPKEQFVWQDPVPPVDYQLVDTDDIAVLKNNILKSGLSVPELVRTAWASASSYRNTDMRGGANGARLRLSPQMNWAANDPKELAKVLKALEKVQNNFNKNQKNGTRVSLADLIVLGGAAAIEKASHDAGHDVQVPFTPGRTDASQAQTDVNSFAVLETSADGFRNYFDDANTRSPAEMLVEKAALLNLSIPEMTVLVGGMRTLNANTGKVRHGVFTDHPGHLSNDFFKTLLDPSIQWKKAENSPGIYEGNDRKSDKQKWTATPVDLIFGSNSELRAVAEVYAFEGSEEKFAKDFVGAWTKVMNLGRF
ncbi:MAG: catalase/peroxidase HPI [Robiginitomaculum sp.]|nr:MAG: catalase/peroxidase HPI [Robiginitomaculum sp.]